MKQFVVLIIENKEEISGNLLYEAKLLDVSIKEELVQYKLYKNHKKILKQEEFDTPDLAYDEYRKERHNIFQQYREFANKLEKEAESKFKPYQEKTKKMILTMQEERNSLSL